MNNGLTWLSIEKGENIGDEAVMRYECGSGMVAPMVSSSESFKVDLRITLSWCPNNLIQEVEHCGEVFSHEFNHYRSGFGVKNLLVLKYRHIFQDQEGKETLLLVDQPKSDNLAHRLRPESVG